LRRRILFEARCPECGFRFDVLEGDAPLEQELDYYVADPDLELIIADAEALRAALVEGPILVAGNKLIN
jgi:hypothetical protein